MKSYLQQPLRQPDDERPSYDAVRRTRSVLSNWRLISAVAIPLALLGLLHALTVAPVFQANMLIQIKRSPQLAAEQRIDMPAATEVEILRSRSVLGGVVDALRLDISVEPRRFPVLGAFLARHGHSWAIPGLSGSGNYAWADERVTLARFAIPHALLGRPFVLTATGQGGFTLAQQESGILVSGEAGTGLRAMTPHGALDILVTDIRARPGTQFVVSRVSRFQAVDRLQHALVIGETAKQSNVIGLSLKGSDPELLSRILNQVGSEYLKQHASDQSGAASAALAFYDRQLDESRDKLRQLDARFARVQGIHGTGDPAEESRLLSQQTLALQDRLAEAERVRIELASRYLPAHPMMSGADERVRSLRGELAAVQAKRRSLSGAEREMSNLVREKQINADISAGLLMVRQKLDALDSAGHDEVRLVDRAETPFQPVNLGVGARVALACLGALVAGLLASHMKNTLDEGRRRPPPPRYDGHFRLA
ncbi:Wzz/FepE/Etk N-terminal domain-containing protein [Massilia sp. 9I]|uniref:Wzz/FepE/Etk N-terminal domain-containing protein n=1 Tax=Massilia sp. 9I TaxID=2653152 RepID=UPI0012F08706|nr:Wzz/FepE/Etk N-terminal domain-containing protein [Massilia sp. 9I]VXB89140.1 Tyrosine-protein kinase Wzc [Massilia sp. 9I]